MCAAWTMVAPLLCRWRCQLLGLNGAVDGIVAGGTDQRRRRWSVRVVEIVLQIVDGDVEVLGVFILRIEHMSWIVHAGQSAAQIHQRLGAMTTTCSACSAALHQRGIVELLCQCGCKHAGVEFVLRAKCLTASTLVVHAQSHSWP